MKPFDRAYEIINKRSEEKERKYGPIDDSFIRAAKIASLMTGKEITPVDAYTVMIAVKLSRESHCHKEDNLVDAIAYLGALANFKSNQEHEK